MTVTYASASTPQSINSYGSTGSTYGTWVGHDRTVATYGESPTVYSGLKASYKSMDGDGHKFYTEFDLDLINRTSGDGYGGG